jgi:hypothetical protein
MCEQEEEQIAISHSPLVLVLVGGEATHIRESNCTKYVTSAFKCMQEG